MLANSYGPVVWSHPIYAPDFERDDAQSSYLLAEDQFAENRLNRQPTATIFGKPHGPSLPLRRRVSAYNDHDFAGEVRHLGGTPPEIMADAEMMRTIIPILRTIIPILRNDSALAEAYVASADDKIHAPMLMVAASDDHLVTVEEARRWGRHAGAGFDWRMVDGGHFFLRQRRIELLGWLSDALRANENTNCMRI